jgi:hypothetical protein
MYQALGSQIKPRINTLNVAHFIVSSQWLMDLLLARFSFNSPLLPRAACPGVQIIAIAFLS